MSQQLSRPVLITGSSGFIGLAVTEALLQRGTKVVGFDLEPPPATAINRFDQLPGEFVYTQGNVQDVNAIVSTIAANGVDSVVALAAITADLERERRAARSVIDVNVGGTVATLEAARKTAIKRLVYISSGSTYGAAGYQEELLVEDKTPTLPESLYGISKLAAEQTSLRLGYAFDVDVVVGRLGTCFGPWEYTTGARDTPSAVYQIISDFKDARPVSLPRPHPKDWLYSRDAAHAILTLLDAGTLHHRIYNLAAGYVWSLVDLCELLQRTDATFEWAISDASSNSINLYGSLDRAPMDCTRIRNLGFEPRYDLEPAARDYLAWWSHSQ